MAPRERAGTRLPLEQAKLQSVTVRMLVPEVRVGWESERWSREGRDLESCAPAPTVTGGKSGGSVCSSRR